jgi:prefoldin subunit 5
MITQKDFNTVLLQINEAFKELQKRIDKLEEDQKRLEPKLRRELMKKIRDYNT